jgi:hypothetical protein
MNVPGKRTRLPRYLSFEIEHVLLVGGTNPAALWFWGVLFEVHGGEEQDGK